jgi:conjugative relaxase-like TrwC/TraI family protein
LEDRFRADGRVVRAVAGFDATFSAPKSLSVLWALTGDDRLLEAHDVAVTAALAHVGRFGSTTRLRVSGGRQFVDTAGLTIATFRQTTSRADDPQIHTHAVISAKVSTSDGRWWALDARYLKRKQRMIGGIYQSVLRAELAHRFGVGWEPVVNGQAEIAGTPPELLEVFSKRAGEVEAALEHKVDEFRTRQGREPTRWEHAALTREAAVDTRAHKSGNGVANLRSRWLDEAVQLGWDAPALIDQLTAAGRAQAARTQPTVEEVVDVLSAGGSTWTRGEVMRTICDLVPPVSQMSGHRWAQALERACDRVLEHGINLDHHTTSTTAVMRRGDGRSVWVDPLAPHLTTEQILAEEERIVVWAADAQLADPAPSTTVNVVGLDVCQAEAARAIAGHDRLAVVVGPAGAGKTTMLERAVADLHTNGRPVFGVAPTAKAARVLERETRMRCDTVAKLLWEHTRPDRDPQPNYQLAAGATVIVDEAGMIGTHSLHTLLQLADPHHWRLALVGDPRQLQAVGRGGMFSELCTTTRSVELEHIHRFVARWEAAASRKLRHGDPSGLNAYFEHGRVIAATLAEHTTAIADEWITHRTNRDTVAITTCANEHVDAINRAIQATRLDAGHLNPDLRVAIGGGEHAHPGDVVATRRNDRHLVTNTGEPVRNRELWTVTDTHPDGELTVTHLSGHGTVTLPADYASRHVRLGYAATEHGNQSDTVTVSTELVTPATTRRGLYVGVTRGQHDNTIRVVTDTHDLDEARDVLEAVLATDRVDVPAVTQRRRLAAAVPPASTPRPRCSLPNWFDDTYHQAAADLADAHDALDELRREDARIARRIRDLTEDLNKLQPSCDPYDTAIAAARDDVTQAQERQRQAERAVDDSGLLGRPAARRNLAETTAELVTAETTLVELRRRGAPLLDRRNQLRHERDRLHQHVTVDRRLLRALDDRESILAVAQQTVHALDTWRHWATGHNVSPEQLADAVDILHHTDRADHAALAAPVATWMAEHNLTPQRPYVEFDGPWLERPGLEIDF